eukprot:SAG31_NODE_533_length_14371_cov_6.455367_4_plen_52_part_00
MHHGFACDKRYGHTSTLRRRIVGYTHKMMCNLCYLQQERFEKEPRTYYHVD